MKKKAIATVCFILLFSLCCFAVAPTAYIDYNAASINADLGSKRFGSHTSSATYNSGTAPESTNTSNYYESQIIGKVGLTFNGNDSNSYGDVTITVESDTSDWFYYLYDGDTVSKRPFGVDLFVRGEKTGNISDLGNYTLRIGNQGNAESTYSKTISSGSLRTQNSRRYTKVWWDICLVLDPKVDGTSVTYGGETYNLSPSNAYYCARMNVTISCGSMVSETYDIVLSSYFNPSGISGDLVANMVVTPLPSANTLNIRSIFESSRTEDVASYLFLTNSKVGSSSGTVSVFLSSSNNGVVAGSRFALVKENSNTRTNQNSIEFNALIRSNSGTTKTFTGTDTTSTTSNHYVIQADHQGGYSRWFDDGVISIEIPTNQSLSPAFANQSYVSGLTKGEYTSNIYVHIITNNI